ncbi:MAG: hypothetical protein ACP5SH_07055 [Syntrophobacteraceae bacterium]
MKKTNVVLLLCIATAAAIALSVPLVKASEGGNALPDFGSTYQAVLLDDGQVFYGKLSGLGTQFPEMTDVYYIVNQQDPKTKKIKHILVKRGKELHQPTKTYLNVRHIVMIEPVGPGSEVARLIAESQKSSARNHSHKKK